MCILCTAESVHLVGRAENSVPDVVEVDIVALAVEAILIIQRILGVFLLLHRVSEQEIVNLLSVLEWICLYHIGYAAIADLPGDLISLL